MSRVKLDRERWHSLISNVKLWYLNLVKARTIRLWPRKNGCHRIKTMVNEAQRPVLVISEPHPDLKPCRCYKQFEYCIHVEATKTKRKKKNNKRSQFINVQLKRTLIVSCHLKIIHTEYPQCSSLDEDIDQTCRCLKRHVIFVVRVLNETQL